MAASEDTADHRWAVIGNNQSFWLYDSRKGFDLTHPPKPSSPPVLPRVRIETTTAPITVDPAKSALVIIDMQNFFLSPAMGRQKGAGHKAVDQLKQYAIPAARKAGMRVIWLNWGLTQKEIDTVPPAVTRAFGFEAECSGRTIAVDKQGNPRATGGNDSVEDKVKLCGMGSWCGNVVDPVSGKTIDAGKLLMRDQWNTELFEPLDKIYQEGRELKSRPDAWICKNRMSGMWGSNTACEEFLKKKGIRTLFFAGVNTDQCVGGEFCQTLFCDRSSSH